MKTRAIWLISVVLSSRAVAQSPAIDSLSESVVPRSGRVVLLGSGFGAPGPGSLVSVGGASAIVSSWTDTSIHAYVSEQAPLGVTSITVATPAGTSNAVDVTVEPRSPSGRALWRFRADADYIAHRPAVASDGTVYVQDVRGHLYALAPDGGLRWIFDAGGLAEGPVGVLSDGTVVVSGNPAGPNVGVCGVHPDGTLRWIFTDPGTTQGIVAGPSVGPDGNVYAVTDYGGLGAFSLDPDGQLRWSNPGTPTITEYGQLGQEVAFGSTPGRMFVAFDEFGVGAPRTLFAFRMADGAQDFAAPSFDLQVSLSDVPQPVVGPSGLVAMNTGNALRAFDPTDGSLLWTAFPFSNGVSKPDVGIDGRIYTVRQLFSLTAVNPDGSTSWTHTDAAMLFAPVVTPDGSTLVMGGRLNFGQPGIVKAFSTSGSPLWQVDLPDENGGNTVPMARPCLSPDAGTVYVGTAGNGYAADPYCYLYAIQVGEGGTPGQFCFGDGSGGACPCGNTGVPGHGCENSAGTGGARLEASGTTSPDSIVLTATGELPSALTIFLQGSAQISTTTYGDGLRCFGGTLKRLYARNASGGVVSTPSGSDLPITERSMQLNDPIAPGSTRYYMTYYRDPAAGFCTPATFNGSSAVALTW